MKFYSFAHKDTGVFHPQTFGTDDDAPDHLRNNTPPDHIAVEGIHDRANKRLDLAAAPEIVDAINSAGQAQGTRTVHRVVDYVPPPPSADHEWNADTKRWQWNAATVAKAAKRAVALAQVAALEASGIRAGREALLGQPGAQARLAAIDAEIVRVRADL